MLFQPVTLQSAAATGYSIVNAQNANSAILSCRAGEFWVRPFPPRRRKCSPAAQRNGDDPDHRAHHHWLVADVAGRQGDVRGHPERSDLADRRMERRRERRARRRAALSHGDQNPFSSRLRRHRCRAATRYPEKASVTVLAMAASGRLPFVLGNPSGVSRLSTGTKPSPAWSTTVAVLFKAAPDSPRSQPAGAGDCILWPDRATWAAWADDGRAAVSVFNAARQKFGGALDNLEEPGFDEQPPEPVSAVLSQRPRAIGDACACGRRRRFW